ncbi:MAG: thiamine pyrophosphate-dependent dehydrogenase E1 component subunit alpha, partial [Proteobacteria bacterium]|nr:thiamine pyrophosphate-dependent dehydrogenase E1 component subunit alpha [Pseudomonadota bacterium]
MDRAEIVHQNFLRRVQDGDLPPGRGGATLAEAGLSEADLVGIFRAQVLSRQLDRISRKLQARGEGYYTIGSSGHEGVAAVAAAFRPTDMAFLHYRDAAFQIQRSSQVAGQTPLWDLLLSFTVSSEDPVSGGRHKVLGSKALAIPPQTSTIASHLPKAVGAAYSIAVAKRLRPEHQALPDDAVVLCSFGDASVNHSTAQGAFNTAGWTAWQGVALPLVFICEDNGIGISTRTPGGWIEASIAARPGLEYFRCNGLDVLETYRVARQVEAYVRQRRKPAFLHLGCVRLYGHAGADVQTAYLSKAEIESDEANDPLLHTARALIEHAVLTADQVLEIYAETFERTARVAEEAITRPKLRTAAEVMASLIPPKRACAPTNGPSPEARAAAFGAADMRAMQAPQHMARLINFALADLMLEHREIVLA